MDKTTKRPPHRVQTDSPGRKAPRRVTENRTVRISPDSWAIAMDYAIAASVKKGYIVTMREALDDIIQAHGKRMEKEKSSGDNQ